MPKPDLSRIRRTAAAAVVFDTQGRLLLQKRSDNGRWALPGGTVETGETVEQAVIREVREETGYEISALRLVGVYSRPEETTMTYPDGNTLHHVSVLFEGRIAGGAPAVSDESTDVDWFFPAQLPQPFQQGHLIRIQDALAGKEAAFYR